MTPRTYYRSIHDGQRGYLVDEGGELKIRYDKERELKTVKFDSRVWQPEVVRPPLTHMQKASVAWDADKALARLLHDPDGNRKDWISASDEERIDFAKNGPDFSGKRREVFEAIMGALDVQ